jgi:tRNA(Ile)-lysidine synthase
MLCEDVRELVRSGGMFARDRPLVVMLSGGRDSTCLLDVAVALLGHDAVSALHVNYGLREQADADERHCAALCRQLEVALEVLRAADLPESPAAAGPRAPTPDTPSGTAPSVGNLQAWARELRYTAAARIAERSDALIATGHTASDQVETILYRLAASPGRRALLGMLASDGRLIRPLLGLSREQTAAYCEERALLWREDDSNEDQRYARSRVRHGLLPALRAIHPAAEANVLRTAALLREETELLDELVAQELAGRRRIEISRLRELPPALARLVVVRLAEQAADTYVPQAGARVQELIALGRRGGRAELHVGGQAGAVIEDGTLAMVKLPARSEREPDEPTPHDD